MPSAVPTDTTSWICPGVPTDSVTIITGDTPEISTAGDPYGRIWICRVQTTTLDKGVGSSVSIHWGLLTEGNSYKYTGEESSRVRFPENIWTLPGIEGSGAWATTSLDSTAQWVCGDHYVEVQVFEKKKQRERRDMNADARNLLTSVLPWACGDQPVPGATTSPTPTPTD